MHWNDDDDDGDDDGIMLIEIKGRKTSSESWQFTCETGVVLGTRVYREGSWR